MKMIAFRVFVIAGYIINFAFCGLIMLEPGMMPIVENWPELMGMSSKEAISKLHQHFPKVQVKVKLGMPENSQIELNKIFLHVDQFNKVIYLPTLYSKIPMQKNWPELVGKTVEDAKNMIYDEFPVMQLDVISTNSVPTDPEEPSPLKVKVLVDETGHIVEPPSNE